MSTVDAILGIALGAFNGSFGLPPGLGNGLVVILFGLVDGPLFFLYRLVDFVERGLHRSGDIGTLELDIDNQYAGLGAVQFALEHFPGFIGDFLAFGDHLVDAAIPDNHPHAGF